jgi:hypothetical protein
MTMIIAAIGANALWLLYLWLLSAIGASWISNYKGYGEKWGLGTGLILSLIGVIVWLFVPAKPTSKWAAKRRGEDPDKVTTA